MAAEASSNDDDEHEDYDMSWINVSCQPCLSLTFGKKVPQEVIAEMPISQEATLPEPFPTSAPGFSMTSTPSLVMTPTSASASAAASTYSSASSS